MLSNIPINSLEDLRIIVTNTANKLGVSEAVIEKDYWVTYILDYIFNQCKWSKNFTFKGGTSLSKCYNLIQRFSEDIDLILDWKVLGVQENEPYEERSNRQQSLYNKDLILRTEQFIENTLLPDIQKDFSNQSIFKFNFYIDSLDKQTILVEYPKIFKSNYLTQSIRLEIGALASKMPSNTLPIKPLISEVYPNLFKNTIYISTVAAERTFWEKLTILHHEAHRPAKSKLPLRYARHYYDIYKMFHSDIKDNSIFDEQLMIQVVNFKIKFYPRTWARYEDVLSKKIKLVPESYRLDELEKDYLSMAEMIYGDYPSFNELIDVIATLEEEINA